MARRRKVNIDANPLQSVTIGRTDTKKYGWIGTLFLFIIFIVVIYFLPDIQKAYRDYLYNKAFTNNYVVNNNTTNGTENGANTTTNVTDNSKNTIYAFTNNEVKLNETTFTNISFDTGTLSFLVNNNADKELNLTNDSYFIRLYDESNTQISVIKINGIITNKSNKNFSYQLSVTPTKYNIAKLEESDYDLISLDVDSENKSAMTCKNNNGESIIYFFENDKLFKYEDTIIVTNDNVNYTNLFNEYTTLAASFEGQSGVTATVTEITNGFRYRLTMDYNVGDTKIDNIYYYSKGVSPIKINYEMTAEFFTCS